jgi:parallel beta-helix repeat protein
MLVFAIGCDDDDFGPGDGITVEPGQSIQAAVDAAAPGDTVFVKPGDYIEPHANREAVRITKPLKLIALSNLPDEKVRLLPGPGQRHGIVVEPANPGDPNVEGVEIVGFTVEGFSNNGIWLEHVTDFVIENNETINNLENGIWPTLSANGLVKRNLSYGSLDAALWVEGSENVRVIENEIHSSPTGIEITISNGIHVEGNEVYNNTVGIGLYHPEGAGMPPLEPIERNFGWTIVNNHIYNNNLENPGPPGGLVSELPRGGGILLLGVDRVEVLDNLIENNEFFGVALIDYCLAVDGTDFACSVRPPGIRDTAPEDNRIIGNEFNNNGTNPPPGPFAAMASDLLGVGGRRNCESDNGDAVKVLQPALPECT